jgi:hypothetical protein
MVAGALLLFAGYRTQQITGGVARFIPKPTIIAPPMPAPLPTLSPPQVPVVVPPPVRAPGWKEFTPRTLCFQAHDTYTAIRDQFPMTIGEITRAALETMGYELVQPGESCDATFTVEAHIEALAGTYAPRGMPFGSKCYNGAQAEGRFLLQAPDYPDLTREFGQSTPIPKQIVQCREPDESPFREWQTGYLRALMDIWGTEAVIAMMAVEDDAGDPVALQWRAQDLRIDMTKQADRSVVDERMVPLLIEALDREMDGEILYLSAYLHWLGDLGPAAAPAVPYLAALLQEGCKMESDAVSKRPQYVNVLKTLGRIGEPAAGAMPAIMCFVNQHADLDSLLWKGTIHDLFIREVVPRIGPAAVPYLIDVLYTRENASNVQLAIDMLAALARAGYTDETMPAVPYLVAILQETDMDGARTALRAISGQTELEKPHEFQMWWSKQNGD